MKLGRKLARLDISALSAFQKPEYFTQAVKRFGGTIFSRRFSNG